MAVLLRDAACPACETRPAAFAPGGEELLQALEARVRGQRLWVGALGGAAAFLIGWMPFLPALVFFGVYLWLRLGVLNPLSQFLSPHRRLVTRWTARLLLSALLVLLLVAGLMLSLLPPLAMVGNASLVVLKVWGCTYLITHYLHWQLRREQQGAPVSPLEWLPILGGVGSLLGTCLVLAWLVFRLALLTQGLAGHLVSRMTPTLLSQLFTAAGLAGIRRSWVLLALGSLGGRFSLPPDM